MEEGFEKEISPCKHKGMKQTEFADFVEFCFKKKIKIGRKVVYQKENNVKFGPYTCSICEDYEPVWQEKKV